MVVMAQEYGADVRLVALMQYLRVLFVAGAAALVVRFALGGDAHGSNPFWRTITAGFVRHCPLLFLSTLST